LGLFELKILDAIQQIRFPALDFFMKYISYLGEWGIFYSLLTIILLLYKKTRTVGLVCATALIMNFLLVDVTIKPLVARARPYTFNGAIALLVSPPPSFSFPSGHSSISFAFATSIRPLGKKYSLWAYILASLIAFSRLYLYVHYPSDVLGGIIIGIACGLLARLIWKHKLSYQNN